MEDSKVVLEDGLLLPIPEDVEAELDKILDAEDIDQYGIYPIISEVFYTIIPEAVQTSEARKH